jgi:peptidase S41-like protein
MHEDSNGQTFFRFASTSETGKCLIVYYGQIRRGSATNEISEMWKSILLTLLLFCGFAKANTPSVIPNTAAGQVLTEWLDVLNSDERDRIEAFIEKYKWKRSIDEEMMLRKFSGGFDLVAIEKSESIRIVFRVKEKDSTSGALGKLVVTDSTPAKISILSIYEAPLGAKYADFMLDAAERARVISRTQKFLEDIYIFPDVAKKMIDTLSAHQKRGDYDKIVEGELFSEKLTEELLQISHDKHLSLDFYIFPQQVDHPRSKDDDEHFKKQIERENCGFERAEHLPGNIGYLKFNMFANPMVCGATAIAAMNFIGDSDAIIFDLRENGGGAPRMIALIQTFLFDNPTHLNDLYIRKENETEQSWTLSYVPGKRLSKQPVYVLTSKNTFSGAEEFAYNLKNLKRATLVGETTGGGAHPVGANRIDDHFTVMVPFARAVSPITKTNWEGTGVEPDIKVPAPDALDTAIKMATKKLGEARD